MKLLSVGLVVFSWSVAAVDYLLTSPVADPELVSSMLTLVVSSGLFIIVGYLLDIFYFMWAAMISACFLVWCTSTSLIVLSISLKIDA